MTDDPLDYRTPRRPRYQRTPQDWAWLRRRLLYYLAHVALFFAIISRLGPNLFLFKSPFSPSPAYYVRLTQPFVPMIAAIKAYQRDHGQLPSDSDSLPEDYRPPDWQGQEGEILHYGSITFPADVGTITCRADASTVVEYDFTPATEGWIIHAPRYDGRIKAPIVPAAPPPATHPATNQKNHAAK